MPVPGYPMEKTGVDEGATRGPPPGPVEEAGPLGPSPGIEYIPESEGKKWDNIFRLIRALEPLIAYFDDLAERDPPPPLISQPWSLDIPGFAKTWADYYEMRDDYTRDATALLNEYEKTELGLSIFAQTLVLGVLLVGGALTWQFLRTREERAVTRRMEPDAVKLQGLIPFLPPGTDPVAFIMDIMRMQRKVASDHGYTWPDVIAKGLTFATGLAVVVGAYFLWQMFA